MGTLDELIRDLRKFEGRKLVVKELRKRIRKPVPKVRRAVRRRALDTLPSGGGLNVWVSKARITVVAKFVGRGAGIRMKAGRNSGTGKRSDIRAIDRGRVRAPSWGRRTKGSWHAQTIPDGFFTEPVVGATEWREECVAALDEAMEVIRRG